jgi:hypothetical protein
MSTPYDPVHGLYIFRSLIKDGCAWRGDVSSHKYIDCLYFEDNQRHQVMLTLNCYSEGLDYKLEGNSVWIT